MVTLTNPDPDPPVAGQNFSITAQSPPGGYTFKWKVDEQQEHVVHQVSGTLNISVPSGSEGELLNVKVTDADNNSDRGQWTITGATEMASEQG